MTLSPASSGAVTVRYTTSDGTATAGTDYTAAANRTLTLGAGSTSATLTIATTPDTTAEDDETFTVTLSSPSSNAELGAAKTATGTIEDDDGTPTLTIESAATAAEGDDVEFTVTLSHASSSAVTVRYTTSDGTATAGTDYTAAANRTLTLGAGSTSATLTIATTEDTDDEEDETFTVTLSSPSSNAALGTPKTATGTIEDDDVTAEPLSTNATLRGLVLYYGTDAITLTPAFSAQVTSYTASVANVVAKVTVAPTAEDPDAALAHAPSVDSDLMSAGHQVALSVGANTIEVEVTAEDGNSTETYTVTVTRALGRVAGVALTPGSGQLKVDWTAVTGADGYRVQWRSGGETFADAADDDREAVVGSGTTTTRTITGLANGTAYTVRVKATKAGLEDGPASAEMTETPALPALTIEDATATEGAGVAFTVTLSRAAAGEVTVEYTTSDGTGVGGAEAGTDYTAASGRTLTLGVGSTQGTFTIATTGDATDENDETFTVTLSSPSTNAKLGSAKTATGTIVDDDGTPTVSIEDAEADEGAGVEFTVNLSHASSSAVTVQYTTSHGTATAGDYTAAANRTLTLGTGSTSATLTIATTEDTDDEPDETFSVTLASPSSNAALGARRTATGTIVDDDLSADATLSALALIDTHGNPIDLTPPTFDPGTFAYTASVASGVASVTVTPTPGDGNAAVAYMPSVDSDSGSEGHQVALSVGENPIEVTVTAEDGNSTRTYTVTVTRALGQVAQMSLTVGSGQLTVRWRAVTGADGYKVQWLSGGETFADAADEGREAVINSGTTTTHTITGLANGTAYTVRVLATKAGLEDGPASPETTVTPTLPALTIEDATATEGAGVAFTVTLSRAAAGEVTVQYTTSGGTATAGTDYTAASGRTLTLGAGSTQGTFTIATTPDATDENDETFTVTLASPSTNAKLGSAKTATGTIVDDDGAPTVSIENAEAEEGEGVEFTVNLSHASAGAVTVQYTTSGGTASSSDYTAAASRTLSITAGETSATLTIATTEDTDDEDDETFTVTLASPSSNAALGARKTATGTIVDDDLSADATLDALVLTDAQGDSIGLTPATFDPATLAYTASVASGVASVTVAPTPGDGNATVAYVPSVDSDLTSDGHQVALAVGENPIEVEVTAEDGNSTETYTVTVTRTLGQVTGESLTPGAGRLTVGWSAVTGADGYKVQWKSGWRRSPRRRPRAARRSSPRARRRPTRSPVLPTRRRTRSG